MGRVVPRFGVDVQTGNVWDLTERLFLDLQRTASGVRRP